ncbi:substrate-binding domain-containing protein [Pontixanthobacter aestiaquae]|uniref:Phosphate ABC transporter substrate-binding protein n=1 Tax=Pontixanthobacter aestiaquae TaxID=1509367 RepID=A0A844Z4Y8_9SPHN|nr:substrate-binding domain-containing protein [Pontixanthobacter aestiaquae]MDN3646681.1 substrate-binding domain-containing protein [Pontixanthobacter aestiaquae]MXO82336.1 phosphate ABC transporter substrate-binding protein [Pontixanthobacter aestiaquae]
MRMISKFSLAAVSALALGACSEAAVEPVHVVGSSTVFPFAKVVAENAALNNEGMTGPLIESNGSGGGIKQFCAGVGNDTPDVVNASRRMKASEFATCMENGVTDVVEIQVGLDGIAFASAQGGITMNLTPEIVYRALAKAPFGGEQTAETWADVDPSLPAEPILVYGPPSTSGTRDALKELVLEAGCKTNPEMQALKESDEDRYDQICTEVRGDGKFVDQGENDNLIVQKIGGNDKAIGVFGFSYLEENADKVQGLPMNGSDPTYDNIASFAYPGARPLYMYVKKQHVGQIPALDLYLAEWAKSWDKDGPLAKIGLVASPDDVRAENVKKTTEFMTLTADDLK